MPLGFQRSQLCRSPITWNTLRDGAAIMIARSIENPPGGMSSTAIIIPRVALATLQCLRKFDQPMEALKAPPRGPRYS